MVRNLTSMAKTAMMIQVKGDEEGRRLVGLEHQGPAQRLSRQTQGEGPVQAGCAATCCRSDTFDAHVLR
jgi:hypothetical protein